MKCIEDFKARTLETAAVKRFGLVDLAYAPKEPDLKFAPFTLSSFSKGKAPKQLTETKVVLANAGSDSLEQEKTLDILTTTPSFVK